jgi:hypothetical protein
MGGHPAVKLVLVDVDGTLVGKDGVPPCVWPRVEALRAKGVRLSLITGRPGRGETLGYARRLDPTGLHVFESGAVVLALSQDPHGPPATPVTWPPCRKRRPKRPSAWPGGSACPSRATPPRGASTWRAIAPSSRPTKTFWA